MSTPQPQPAAVRVTIGRQGATFTIEAGAFGPCLLQALLASLPTFITEFAKCLAAGDGGNPGVYDPGDRPRCK